MAEPNAPSLFTRLAVIKAMKEAVTAAERDVKAALESTMDAGDRKQAVHDGHDQATITYSKTSAKAVCTDTAAFTEWCIDAHPTEVAVVISVDADDLLAAMLHLSGLPDGDDEDAETKAARASAYHRVMGKIQVAQPHVRAAYADTLAKAIVKAKAPVDPATGEMVPGWEYVPGGQPGYVSARQSEDQRQALLDLYAAGALDLVALSTEPVPAIEGGQ